MVDKMENDDRTILYSQCQRAINGARCFLVLMDPLRLLSPLLCLCWILPFLSLVLENLWLYDYSVSYISVSTVPTETLIVRTSHHWRTAACIGRYCFQVFFVMHSGSRVYIFRYRKLETLREFFCQTATTAEMKPIDNSFQPHIIAFCKNRLCGTKAHLNVRSLKESHMHVK